MFATVSAACATAFLLWPRPVTVETKYDFYAQGLIGGEGDQNCPATEHSCAERAHTKTINSTNVSQYQIVCNHMPGCIFTPHAGCVGCSSLLDDEMQLCKMNQQCVYIDPPPGPKGVNKNSMANCESSQMGPVEFSFNYTFRVVNPNYIATTLRRGAASLSFSDTTEKGAEITVSVADVKGLSITHYVNHTLCQSHIMSITQCMPSFPPLSPQCFKNGAKLWI